MPLSLLLLSATCIGFAACQGLEIQPSVFMVELDKGKDNEPTYLLKKQYIVKIQCSMRASNESALLEPAFVWRRQNSVAELDSRYSIKSSLSEDKKNFTSALWIRKPNNEDIINYTCNGTAKNFPSAIGVAQVQSRPLISFTVVPGIAGNRVFDVALWPGSSVSIMCEAEGNPASSFVRWYKGGNIISNSSWLNMTNLSFETDRGFAVCSAINVMGENNATIYLRVKNPKAYLAPLLIIIAEVIVIALVVGLYELYMYRKRKQNQLGESADAYKTE